MTEQMEFPRRDDGPTRVLAKVDSGVHGKKFIKIKIFCGSRKALQCK